MILQVRGHVPRHRRGEVEALFFFNPRQTRCLSAISGEIERSGPPRLIERQGQLRLVLPLWPDVQSYFFLNEREQLVGAAMALLAPPDTLRILHWAVHPDWTAAKRPDQHAALSMLGEIQRIARRIQGLRKIELPYRGGSVECLPRGTRG